MKPIEFPEANVTFAKDQPEYEPLPAYKKPNDPQGLVVVKFELSQEEMGEIFQNGTIYLSMLTFNQPLQPIRLSVLKPEI